MSGAYLPRILFWVATPFLILSTSLSQTQPNPSSSETAASENSSEISSHDEATTFKVNVKLVMARVVVRDRSGHAVGSLRKEDFQLFDKGKPQIISRFEVEQPGTRAANDLKTSDKNRDVAATGVNNLPSVPERFTAYVFDDEHLEFGSLAKVRDAALRHFNTLKPTDRAALFTTSGTVMLDFTDDRDKLHDALLRLKPITETAAEVNPCPDISYYMADLIVNQNSSEALKVGIQDYISCAPSPQIAATVAPHLVPATAQQVLSANDRKTHLALGIVKDVESKISRLPGQRSIILISSGFLTPQMQYEFSDIIDRAVRSQVVISTLDARGLYALVPGGDAGKRGGVIDANPGETILVDYGALRSQYESQSASVEADVLASLANSTGGTFVHNNNDFDEGFRQVAETSEFTYLLGFIPQSLKPDGSFHALRVTLKNAGQLSAQTRPGYYAPKKLEDPAELAKQEIQDAMYSQEELQAVPLDLHTQFFKESDAGTKLSVLAHLDARRLHFRKADGRNDSYLTYVSALFNRNGDFVEGNQKVVTMRLKDDTLERTLAGGVTLKTTFDVKPGSYVVRVVIRDADGQLSAKTGAIEIP